MMKWTVREAVTKIKNDKGNDGGEEEGVKGEGGSGIGGDMEGGGGEDGYEVSEEEGEEEEGDKEEPPSTKGKGKQPSTTSKTPKKGQSAAQSSPITVSVYI